MKTVRVSWLAEQNILIDSSMGDIYTLYQHYLATELIRRLQSPLLQDLLQQPVALKKNAQGVWLLANNFTLLVLIHTDKFLRIWKTRKLEVIGWSEIKHPKMNLIAETLNVLAVISRSGSNLRHSDIFKILKKQLHKEEWQSFHGKDKFQIADYLERVGISQSTFDRSRGRL